MSTTSCPTVESQDLPPWADAALTDRALLDAMVRWQVQQNRAQAARLEALSCFHERRVAESDAPAPGSAVFRITPLRETQAEVGPLLGSSEQTVAFEVDTTQKLKRWLPRLWDRCRAGRLDLARALACLDQLPSLANDEDRQTYATAIQDWFDRHDPPDQRDPDDPGLCALTRDRIRRAARYQRLKLPRRDDTETFAQAFKKRRVSLHVDQESGLACLSGTLAAHDAITADHRLTMIAKKRAQAPGETRTLAQLRADSLVDLIHGRLVVPATTGDLEHHEHCDHACRVNGPDLGAGDGPTGHDAPSGPTCPLHPLVLTADNGGAIGGFARPVIMVTVPISTLLGYGDAPGLLSGGIPIPADYARHIAVCPGSTWHRMLTDDVGGFLAVSTQGYQPTDPIWRTTTARDQTCVWPGCRRPSVESQLDHRTPYPEGETSTDNLAPLCGRHHQVKHADGGYSVARNADGSHTWTTRHGSTFTTPAGEQPVDRRRDDVCAGQDSADQDSVDRKFAELTGPLEKSFAGLIQATRRVARPTAESQRSLP